MGKIQKSLKIFGDKKVVLVKRLLFAAKNALLAVRKALLALFIIIGWATVFGLGKIVFRHRSRIISFRNWQAKLGKDLFHIFPDPLAVLL